MEISDERDLFNRKVLAMAELEKKIEIGKQAPLDEKSILNEMAIVDISQPEERWPFKICVNIPETSHRDFPHAHLFDSVVRDKDLGMRLKIYPNVPQSLADIQDAIIGKNTYSPIPEEWKELIFKWAKMRSRLIPELSNWRDLWGQWLYSLRSR